MPPSLANPVQQYIVAMRTAHSFGANTAETTFYTPLANLLNAVGERLTPRVYFQAHPGSHGAGLADGGLFPLARKSQREPLPGQLPERGAVEIKAPGASLATLGRSAQVRRYLETYGLCLITNYHQFQLLELLHGQPHILESYDLTATAGALWSEPAGTLAAQHEQTLSDFLQRVMIRKVPLEKPKDVAWLLASYAREARTRASTHPLAAFDGVKSALQESLGITFEGGKGENFFLSTLIQTLFYGIFSAWILWRRTPEGHAEHAQFNWRLSASYLRLPVLRALFHAVIEPGALDTVQVVEMLEHAGDALNRVESGFFATFNDDDAVNYFYEPFLEAFDPELRKQLGVWYTPREIVRYMVERVDHLLRTELNELLGLASPNVQVLDPCCGTGAYLVEVLHRIERTLRDEAGDDDALVSSDLRRAATTRVFGFEIMPAPFVIAHLQLANLLEKAGASLGQAQRAQVFLTNALTGWVPVSHPQSRFGFPAFTEERDAAESVKQADTILVILGNPPYNGYAGIAQIDEERGLTTAYREQVFGLTAPQGQGLNDLYVRFFRIAERRIVGDASVAGNPLGRGLVSFISNNAWLDGLSHVSMRARYLSEFQHIYIDNLNGDKYRTGKTTPDGKPDPSAFSTPQNREGIQVGTCITTLVRTSSATTSRGIALRDVWGAHKLSHLEREAHREAEPMYSDLKPNRALGLPFAARVVSAQYPEWPRLLQLFPTSSTGVTSSRDPLVIDIDRERLSDRMRRYLSDEPDSDIARDFPAAMKASARFDPDAVRGLLRRRGYRDWQILRYCYRPFDLRWIYWEPTTKLLDEKRRDFVAQLGPENPWLEARQKEIGEFSRGTVSGELCDHFGNGPSNFVPLTIRVPDIAHPYGRLVFNLSQAGADFIYRTTGVSPDEDASERESRGSSIAAAPSSALFFHALSVMHTPQYRTENAGALLNDWPRILLPATAESLTVSAILGHRLAELLDAESGLMLGGEWGFLARLSIPPEVVESTPDRDRRNESRLAVTAGWGGRGQGETVMPRRGDARERDWSPTELSRLAALAATQGLTSEQTQAILAKRCVDVYLNGEALWAAVPLHVWQYTLGGYQVLKKWLSYREEPLLGRPLKEEEARYFAQVVRRIAAILLLGPALNASYAAILPTATGLPE